MGSSRIAREIEHHSRIAGDAESTWDWASPAGQRRAEFRGRLLAEAVQLGAGTRALEVGCGTGLISEKALVPGCAFFGLDLSIDLLGQARDRFAGRLKTHLLKGNAEALPFPENTFDAVFGSSILHHLDIEKTLREVHRVLRTGGRAAFAEPNLLNPQVFFTFHSGSLRARLGVSPDEMAFTPGRGRRALRSVGFVEVEVRCFDFLHPAVPPWAIAAVSRVGRLLERVPVVRRISGSQLMTARKA